MLPTLKQNDHHKHKANSAPKCHEVRMKSRFNLMLLLCHDLFHVTFVIGYINVNNNKAEKRANAPAYRKAIKLHDIVRINNFSYPNSRM